jgi:hypothetical protein
MDDIDMAEDVLSEPSKTMMVVTITAATIAVGWIATHLVRRYRKQNDPWAEPFESVPVITDFK